MSNSNAQKRSAKSKRPYRQRKRAEQQEETRQRIVEAAVELHCSVGPARTTVSQIAERAGVQRNTYYAHFPEERDLFLACSGLALERDPLPDPAAWEELPTGRARIEAGLVAIYRWYERNRGQAEAVTRDMAVHDLTRAMMELLFAPVFARAASVLGDGLSDRAKGLLAVALEFPAFRTLSQWHTPESAAALMAEAIAAL
jgi:AcrR family transcriptional regulator